MIQIALVDDNPFFCSSMSSLINDSKKIVLKDIYHSLDELFIADLSDISILFLDNQIYGESSINYIEKIKILFPDLKIIMLTVSEDDYSIFKSLEKGVNGYLVKGVAADKIIECVESINKGNPYVCNTVMNKMVLFFNIKETTNDRLHLSNLSDKEEEILFYLSRGLQYCEIAQRVYLSESGVKYYLKRVYKKLKVRNRTEATRLFLHGNK
jgi:DNA-binding NarL/FixJ family response regulator